MQRTVVRTFPAPCRRLLLGAIVAALAMPNAVFAAQGADEELLAAADTRIEQCRKADATVVVVDTAGKPVAGAKIDVQLTRHAFLFGCNIFCWGKVPDDAREQAYRRRFAELLNYATLPFYWSMYESRQGSPMHAHTAEVARWCRAQGIVAKGHPLAWNHADPAWLPGDPAEIHRLQLARIDDCVKRFSGLIDRWDVVNEVTHYDREEFAKRAAPKYTAMWKQYGQIAMPRECFLHARQANPQAVLVINDYRTDPAYERVIEQLVDPSGKRLYDVIGIQSHMHGGVWSNGQIWKVCQQFARFGVPLHFTETTILSGKQVWEQSPGSSWPSTPEGEAFQAREAARFYTMLFSHPAVAAITWWDFSDFNAWKGPAGFLRADMTPKPAYEALQRLIKGKWWTRVQIESGADGAARLRGFLGDYRIAVRAGDKAAVVAAFTLEKENANRWTVKIE
jgi:GH35 family endo-1,4-beta-xylanase